MNHLQPAAIRLQRNLWITWLVIYVVLGGLAMMGNRTSIFSSTVDRVQSPAIRYIFLNIPLQIVLALSALVMARADGRSMQKAGASLALLTTALVLTHVAISFITAWL